MISLRKALLRSAAALLAAGPALLAAPWSPSPAEGWRPFPLGELYVKQGSALDFSTLVEPGPAGQHGQVVIDAAGRLVFEKQPDRPLRFFTCGEGMEWWQPETDEEIAAYARQVRLAGYNCFRPHFLDHMLMIGATADLEPNPAQLARWDRLVAELKKQGVYLYIDINTSWAAFHASESREANWSAEARDHRLKTRIYYEDAAREHWEKSMRLLLERVNPHTGTALKDDPQVVFLQLRNEAGLHFQFEHANPDNVLARDFLPPFRRWLEQRYLTVEKLNAAWRASPAHASFDEVPFPPQNGLSAPAIDFQRFIVDAEIDTFHRLKTATERTGTRAIIFDYNVGVQFGHSLSRSAAPVVDSHAYHDHPTAYITPGSSQPNQSSASARLDYFVWLNESRQIDRPFIVSEWGFPYWNQWRHEAGVGLPAYAAFQGWQMLAHHAEPIRPATDIPLRPFKIAYDPPAAAAERMAALLYARGDVAPARHTVELRQDPEGVFTRWGGEANLTPALRSLSLLTGFGLRIVDFDRAAPGANHPPTAALALHPARRAVAWTDAPATPAETAADFAGELRRRGVLSRENLTDPAAGIYETDTRQLLIDAQKKIVRVDTPRSQGASLPEDAAPLALSTLRVENRGPSATFFAAALDSAPLDASRRILLIAVGDAVNTGAVFADSSRRELRELGELPVLAKPLRASLRLRRASDAPVTEPRLWALSFNGERLKRLPLRAEPDSWTIDLDATDNPELGIYYEIEAAPR